MARRSASSAAAQLATTMRGYGRFVRVAWAASPTLAALVATTALLAAVTPLVAVLAVAGVVEQLPRVVGAGLDSSAGRTAVFWAVLVGVLFAVQRLAAGGRSAAADALRDRIDLSLQRGLMSAVNTPVGIAHLEDPGSRDLISVGRETFRGWLRPGRLANHLSGLAAARLMTLGACVILARFQLAAAALFLAASLWTEYEVKEASRRASEHHYGASELSRKVDYFYDLGASPDAAKEVRVFGLAGYLMDRFAAAWQLATAPVFARGSRRLPASAAGLGTAALVILAWTCFGALRGQIGLGAAVAYAQAIVVGLGGVSAACNDRLRAEMCLAALGRYDAADALLRPLTPAETTPGRAVGDAPRREIRFDRVGFRYPGSDRAVLDDLDLVVPAGQSVAIVGSNGAGKTTLIKLLSRLYEPTSGRVLVDEHDLADLDPVSWRRRLSTVFQDYAPYHVDARGNVGFGFVPAMDDIEGMRAAADDAGVADVIDGLPHGWATVLSSEYENGADISGGEWQKVALARALFAIRHGARALILDEPAANLDARAEAQLYERFLALTKELTTIVISHRFSTVRQADRIAVLRDGQVVEQGSHDELLARGGQYAEMFRLQAARFDEPVTES